MTRVSFVLGLVVLTLSITPAALAACNLYTCAYANAQVCGGTNNWCYFASGTHSAPGATVAGELRFTNAPTAYCNGLSSTSGLIGLCYTNTRDSLAYSVPVCHVATATTSILGLGHGKSTESSAVHC